MKISSLLIMGLLLLSVSLFSARENPATEILENVKLLPGTNAVIDASGNLIIDFGTIMPNTEVTLTDAFGIQNLNDLSIKIAQFQIISNGNGCKFAVIPATNILILPGETVWFTVSIESGDGNYGHVSGKIVIVIS